MNEKTKDILSQQWVSALLNEPRIARLGTSNPITNQPHVTPVWFLWDGTFVWISAFISTRKAKDVARNPRISVLIDDHSTDKSIRAVLLEGKTELIDDPKLVRSYATKIYLKYLGEDGIKEKDPASWIIDPENRIIKLFPDKVFAWGPSSG